MMSARKIQTLVRLGLLVRGPGKMIYLSELADHMTAIDRRAALGCNTALLKAFEDILVALTENVPPLRQKLIDQAHVEIERLGLCDSIDDVLFNSEFTMAESAAAKIQGVYGKTRFTQLMIQEYHRAISGDAECSCEYCYYEPFRAFSKLEPAAQEDLAGGGL
jgi:hypothetical protein